MSTTLIRDALIVNEGRQFRGSIWICNERIGKIMAEGQALPHADHVIHAGGKFLLPGVIDDHVHFREPGLTHKGDMASESRAAVAGGITSFMDMPNTLPQTTTQKLLSEKFDLASRSSLANYSFYIGATHDNLDELLASDPLLTCGIKVFMGSSTGNMLVDNHDALQAIFSSCPLPVAIHSEDETTVRANLEKARLLYGDEIQAPMHPVIRNAEACSRSTRLAIDMAEKYGTRLHILHLSTAAETELLKRNTLLRNKRITSEVCVHHLLFNDGEYLTRGNLIKWNPSIKGESDRKALIQALKEGVIDIIATDHAPHTLEEKMAPYLKSPSGAPMVQHALVAMLEFYHAGEMPIELIVDKMCHAPAILFGIRERGFIREGCYADLVLVDPRAEWTVTAGNILYKCGWSPLEGMTFRSKVSHCFVNGNLVYIEGKFFGEHKGKALEFQR